MEEEKTEAPQGLVTHLPRSHASGFEEASLAAKPVHMALPQSRATGAKLGLHTLWPLVSLSHCHLLPPPAHVLSRQGVSNPCLLPEIRNPPG